MRTSCTLRQSALVTLVLPPLMASIALHGPSSSAASGPSMSALSSPDNRKSSAVHDKGDTSGGSKSSLASSSHPVSSSNAAGTNPGSSTWDKVWSPNFQDYWGVFQPAFENNSISNVSVHVGEVAFLPCPVRFLGDRSISWIRQSDLRILTSGRSTYTSDDRFQVLHAGIADNWALQIKFVKMKDAGVYECQISTGQGIISTFINLVVLEPRTSIFGNAPERHVQLGSTITLTCIVENTAKPVIFVLWYQGDKSLNYEKSDRIVIRTDAKTIQTPDDGEQARTTSTLTITNARHLDAGNYTCAVPNARSSSVTVFVSEQGDTQASMERRSNSATPFHLSKKAPMAAAFSSVLALITAFCMSCAFDFVPR